MTIKYYLGDEEVPYDVYQAEKTKAEDQGRTIKSSEVVDGYPTYTLVNGTVIRGDKQGSFNRMENGEVMEKWMPGTANEWIQQEPTEIGEVDFFFQKG